MQNKYKRGFVVGVALLLGFLMPYISRIPNSFTLGTAWIFKYMHEPEDFLLWNVCHIFSLFAIFSFGLLFVFGNINWGFYASVVGHFCITSVIYHNFSEPPASDDFLGSVLFPPAILIVSSICGSAAFATELVVMIWKRKQLDLIELRLEN
jgi:hypothetical protein